MENIKKHLDQAEEKLRLEWQEKEKRVIDDIERTKNEITDLAKTANFSLYSILDFENQTLDGVSENQNLPELVRIGTLNPVNFNDKMPEIPMLLPFSENAVSFILNENDKRNVHTLFELIAFRLMLSLPLNLSKFYFVDNNLGGDFPQMTKIKPKSPKYCRFVSEKQDRDELFAELVQIVNDFNLQHKASFGSLKEYNKTADEMQKPYHFVFINNFPAGFTIETAEKLLIFINNGNAAKAGVFLFFSIDRNEKPKYGIDIDQFSKSTTCICQNSKNEYKIESLIFMGQFNTKFNIMLDKSLPSNVDHIIDLINKKEVTETKISFEEDYQKRLKEGDFWKDNTIEKIKIPIGYVNPKQEQYLEFSEDTNCYSGSVTGLSGMGKTVLLHNIILWGAMEYSPFELEYYLIDCKYGTEFNNYKDLPHNRTLSADNNRNYIADMFAKLVAEIKNRATIFSNKPGIGKIETYRKETGERMPRIIVIVDEAQILFENDDKIARTIRENLDKIVRQGRSQGVHALLCTQRIGNITEMRQLIKDMNWRLSFKLQDEMDSILVLGDNRALKLKGKGNAIIKEDENNTNFQVGMVNTGNISKYIEDLNKTFAERYPNETLEEKFIFDGNTSARIEKNEALKNNIINNSFKPNDKYCDVYIGEPAFIRNEHAKIRIRKQGGSNIILVGSDIKSAVSIIGLVNYQLIRQSSEESKFYIVNCFNIDDEKYNSECFDFAKKYFPNQLSISKSKNITSVVDDIEVELRHRIDKYDNEEEIVGGRIVLSVAYMQNCRALKKDGYNDSPVTKKLIRIIKEGAEYGIHVLLYSLTYQGVTDILGIGGVLNEFENRMALDSGKSMGIITEQTGTKITEKGTALLQAPDEFTTYNPDLIRVYSQFNIDENNKDVDFIDELLKIGL